MAPRKKAAKKKPAKKRAAKKSGATKGARRRKASSNHDRLTKAHGHVMRVIESATVDDREHIDRIRRALDHADDNAKRRKTR